MGDDELKNSKTNQALKWAKGGISGAKLYIYHKTGQIQESEDSVEVTKALQRLTTYRDQIDSLLRNAENWTKSMLQTKNYQTDFIYSLNVSSKVIPRINGDAINDKNNENGMKFKQIVQGISTELTLDQQRTERNHLKASKLLVVPLHNILNHEIQHALDCKKKYILNKRQYDNYCTIIANLKSKIKYLQYPKSLSSEKNEKDKSKITKFGKFGRGFNKLMQSNQSEQELQIKLKHSLSRSVEKKKVFNESKKQLLESINIVEEKLNVEFIHYIQKFYQFVQTWKADKVENDDKIFIPFDESNEYESLL